MITIEEKVMALQKNYQNVAVSVDGNNVDVTLRDAMFSLASPGVGILLPATKVFEVRAVQKGVVEFRLFFDRDSLERAIKEAE